MVTYLTVHLDDGTNVDLFPDGSARVGLAAMRSCRHDLHGQVFVSHGGTVTASMVEDAYVNVPLRPHVVRAAENAARKQARKARRIARQIATGPVTRYEPGTLEHLVMLAEGRIREDGWPKGSILL